MLRIIFGTDDIARTRLAARADALWELVASIQMLRGQPGDLLFTRWRHTAVARLRALGGPSRWRTLLDLVPTLGYFPDFLNPAAGVDGLARGLDAIRSTPRHVLTRDLRRLGPRSRPHQDWAALAAGDAAELTRLTDVMGSYYGAVVEPVHATLETAVERDRQLRFRAFAEGGVEGMLASLGPTAVWSPGELRIPAHRDQVISLDGRGLVLVPSYFCVNHPMTLFDGSLPPVLVYPVARRADAVPTQGGPRRALATLIGTTRAAVLEAMWTTCGTTELARRAGVSLASASEHAAVLRAAGLIATHRDGRRAVHTLTALGHDLLNGGAPNPASPGTAGTHAARRRTELDRPPRGGGTHRPGR